MPLWCLLACAPSWRVAFSGVSACGHVTFFSGVCLCLVVALCRHAEKPVYRFGVGIACIVHHFSDFRLPSDTLKIWQPTEKTSFVGNFALASRCSRLHSRKTFASRVELFLLLQIYFFNAKTLTDPWSAAAVVCGRRKRATNWSAVGNENY